MNGIIKTVKSKAPYTILLTGVGKSSILQILQLIADVLAGNDIDHYDFDTLGHRNEQGDHNNLSRTNSAHLYGLWVW
jgi:hypothetical protein